MTKTDVLVVGAVISTSPIGMFDVVKGMSLSLVKYDTISVSLLSICKIVGVWSKNDAWDICNTSGFVPYMVGLEMGDV